MNKIENYTTHLWNSKTISEPDEEWFISKVFKTKRQILPIDKQREIIKKKEKYFWKYIPETHLVETENWEYTIRQKYINGKTLAQSNIFDLSAETLESLLDLIKKYLRYHKEQWWELDLTGYQYYEWDIRGLRRKIKNFLKINENFLVSTNIMISEDWKVYMVDVCESADSRIQWKIKNFCAKPFIRRTIHQLERTLKQELRSQEISEEILKTLDIYA